MNTLKEGADPAGDASAVEPVVLHEGSGVVAICKPAGLPTQAPSGIASAEAWLRHRLGGARSTVYVGVPHRLDRAVSGVLLFATTPRAARKLSRQFERRQIRKGYIAVVQRIAGGDGLARLEAAGAAGVTWHDRVAKVPDEARARIVDAATDAGRDAVTHARLGGRVDERLLVLHLEPHTGRMHQLRLQSAARGLPICGDALYGATVDGPVSCADRSRPIMLHARRITFVDPDGGAEVVVEAPWPHHWPAAARVS